LDHAGVQYEFLEIPDGRSTVAFLVKTSSPNLIISDAQLPGFDLEELLTTLKQSDALKRVPLVVISGMRNPQFIERIKAFGAADYILKPSTLEGWRHIGEQLKQTLESTVPKKV